MSDQERSQRHRKPAQLEELLGYFSQLLGPLEDCELTGAHTCDAPILYIMGCARSGTTVIYQYLAESGLFVFPTNFLSRFYYAPFIGAKLQRMLIDTDPKEEVFSKPIEHRFSSVLGKTRGATRPHEFWYFWRRFFDFRDVQQLNAEQLAEVDSVKFIRELRAFQGLTGLPLVLKGMILNWHIPFLADLYENSYFLLVRRAVPENALSLVRAREEFFGDTDKWYSFKPPGYKSVGHLSPYHQTAWQVLETNAAIEAGFAHVREERTLVVDYERFCRDPTDLLREIGERFGLDWRPAASSLPAVFQVRGKERVPGVHWAETLAELEEYKTGGTLG